MTPSLPPSRGAQETGLNKRRGGAPRPALACFSLQAARTRSRFSCTSGWLAWPRNPIVTDMSPGPAQMAPMPSSDAEMSRMFCTPSASSTMPISKILPQGPGARDRRGRSIPAGSGPVSGGDVSPEPTSSRQHLRHRLRRVPEVRRHRMRYLGVATPTSTTVGVTRLAGPDFMIEIEAIAIVNS